MNAEPVAEPVEPHDAKKERKKQKKQRKAEERAWLEERLKQASGPASRRGAVDPAPLHEWSRALGGDRLVAATKSSALVALNGVMLAIVAHALWAEPAFGALVPLALTNLLSLAFSVAAARQLKEGGFEPPPAALDQSRDELYSALSHELHLRADGLTKCRARLRSAYAVLLGGVLVSAATFAVSLALGGV